MPDTKTTVTTVISDMLPDKEPQDPERITFHGSDISRPYTSPELDDITLGRDISDEKVSPKAKIKTTVTETVSYYEDNEPAGIDGQPEAKDDERDRFPGSSDKTHPYEAPDVEGISLVVDDDLKVPTEDKLRSTTTVRTVITEKKVTPEEDNADDTKPEEDKDVGRFKGSDVSHAYKSPDIEGISLVVDAPKEEPIEDDRGPVMVTTREPKDQDKGTFEGSDISRPYKSPDIEGVSLVVDVPQDDTQGPSEDKVPTKTTVTSIFKETVVSEGDDEGILRGSDFSHPYKSPEIEGVSLVADTDEHKEELPEDKPRGINEDTESTEKEDRGAFKGSDVSHPYKAPDIEGITSKTRVTVITDSVPSKQEEDKEPEEEKEDRDRFHGSDISHPYKSPKIEDISLVKDIPKDERKEPTPKTPADAEHVETLGERETFKGSDISHPYKSPDIEGISLVQEISKEEPSEGKVTEKTTVTTVITDSVPSKQEEDKEPEEEKEARDRFHGSDISHPYKSPEIEDISLVKDVPKDERKEPTPKTPADTEHAETLGERETFKGSDISHPYKSPDIEGISLVQEISKEEPSEGKVTKKTTVTTVITDSVPSKQEEDKEPEEEKEARHRFHGSDISHTYKSPEIEGMTLVTDVPKDERGAREKKVPDDTKPEEIPKDRDTFTGSDISHPYRSPAIEGISLIQETPKEKPIEGKVISKTTVTKVDTDSVPSKEVEDQESKEEKEARDRFPGSDISHPYKSPEIEGISLAMDGESESAEDRERSETTITTVVTEVTKSIEGTEKDRKEDRDVFRGSDISHPYKSPNIKGISLEQEVPTDDKLPKVHEEIHPPKKKDIDDKTEKVDKRRFQGSSNISNEYKAPEIEGISLISDVKEDTKDQPTEEKEPHVEKAEGTKEKETDEDNQSPKTTVTTVVTKTIELPEDEEKFQGSGFSRPYKSPELEEISLVADKSTDDKDEPDEKKPQTAVTTVVTKTIGRPDDEGRFKGSEFSRTQKSMEIDDTSLFREEKQQQPKGKERSGTTVTKTVTKTVVTREDSERTSDVSPEYKAPEIDEIKLVEDEKEPDQKEQPDVESEEEWFESSEESAKTKAVERTTEIDQPFGVTVTVKKTTTTVVDGDKTPPDVSITPAAKEKQPTTETDAVTTTDAALVRDIREKAAKGDEVDKSAVEPMEESDEEWYESSEVTVRSKTVTTTVTTTRGGQASHEAEKRRRKSEDILGDDEGSDSDEMPTKTKKVKTIVRTIKDDSSGLKPGKYDKDEYEEDSYSTTKTVRTVVTSQIGEDKPDQTRSIKAHDDRAGKVEGDQEWSESGEYTTKTQTVTTVVTRTTGSHETGDQKVSTITTDTGIAGEGTESMGETDEVKRSTTIVERNTNIASANQVSSTISLYLCLVS